MLKKLNFSFNSDQNDECCLSANNSKARKQLGFSPMSLEDGLKKLHDAN